MRFSYALPDPASYSDWSEFEGDLVCANAAAYEAVELQIADPAPFDGESARRGCVIQAWPNSIGRGYADA